MLIALTGFMASGKTTVGRLLASSLGCPFLDLDEIIVQKAEKQALEQTVSRYAENTAVLALGGGTVTVPGAIKILQEKTTCIYLQASLESIQARLSAQPGGRPLADEHLAQRFAEREPLYAQAAHVTVDTDGLTPEQITDEIIIDCL